MSSQTEEAFKNRCVVCGEPIPQATTVSLSTCEICGGIVCQSCRGKMSTHYTKYGVGKSFINVCPNCSSKLQDKGNKPINPYTFLGGY